MADFTQEIYCLVAVMLTIFIVKANRKGTEAGKKLATAMLMNFLMICFYLVNLISDVRIIQSFGCSMSFIFMDLMLLFYYDYALCFTEWENRVPKWIKIVFIAYIIIDSLFLLINPFTGSAINYLAEPLGDKMILTYVPQMPFHVHIGFDSIMLVVTILILFMKCFEVPKVFLKRYYGPICAMLLTYVIYAAYLASVFPFVADPTVLLYVFVGLILYFYTFNYLPSVILGITRNMILEYLQDPIILFDYEGKLADFSLQMQNLMPEVSFVKGETTLEDFVKMEKFSGMNGINLNQEFDWSVWQNGKQRIYDCNFKLMKDKKEKLIGRLFVFHDVTDVRRTFFELEKSMIFDSITGFYNKESFYTQMPQWSNPEYWPVSFVVCNVDGMRGINEAYGTAYGDGVMKEVSRYIRRRVGNDTFCAKSDNGDFLIALEKTNNVDAGDIMEAIQADVKDFYDNMPVSIEYGVSTKEDHSFSVSKALQAARGSMQNKKMLKEKSSSSSLVDSLMQTLCESDYQTEEHVERTRRMAARLGREMGLRDDEIGKLELLAVLHDIGKVAIPQDIIKKKGKLTPDERAIIEQHTVKGYRIAKSSPELSNIAEGILSHHEKWDGTGYPNGLKGEEIPLIARIISAVDSHDVMVNDRPYHKAMKEEDAIVELRRCSGTQFDPLIVDIFTAMLEKEELGKDTKESADTSDVENLDAVQSTEKTLAADPKTEDGSDQEKG